MSNHLAIKRLDQRESPLGRLITPFGKQYYMPLISESPAIDAGDPGGGSDFQGNPFPTDIRGVLRDAHCDIGAYEYTAPGPASQVYLISGSPQITRVGLVFPNPFEALALDSVGSPAIGSAVTFVAPTSGPSAVFSDTGAISTTLTVIDSSGYITTSLLIANELAGKYHVTASPRDIITATISYDLENAPDKFYVAGSGNDINDCLSPLTACATIKSAVSKALTGATVYVTAEEFKLSGPAGSYAVWFDKSLHLSGGWDSTFTVQTGKTILDGSAQIGILHVGFTSILEHVWLRNGKAETGGGVYCNTGSLTIRDSAITGNQAYINQGGGINAVNCDLTLENVTISENSAAKFGSGIAIYAPVNLKLAMHNVTIAYNHAGENAGGIDARGGLQVVMENTLVAAKIRALALIRIVKRKLTPMDIILSAIALGAS